MEKSSNKRFPDFFKVYLPARNSHRLHIPGAFVAYCGKLLPKKAVLTAQSSSINEGETVDVSNFVQPRNPHFIAKLRTGAKKHLLHVPSKVLERHKLDLPDLIVFRNEQGKEWPGHVFRWNGGRTWISGPFCTSNLSSSLDNSDLDDPLLNSDTESVPDASPPSPLQGSGDRRAFYDRPLENGLDSGIYKAILVGQVGQSPLQKKLRSGRVVTLFSLGTGGIRNNRRPLENEEPRDYANRCAVQWHRVSVYPERLGRTVMKHAVPGSTIYIEGNLEQKVFNDPVTGLVRRIREIAIRGNGRLVFLGKGGDGQPPNPSEFRGTGYY
ncbi:hypothetical protein Q3G72_009478 [Acer saccharum]|nr:hypothetical protein Q3G72_009478 [Acer saccharum]